MADKRISQLDLSTARNSKVDFLPVLDVSASETKKVQIKKLPLTDLQKENSYPYTTDFQGAVNAAGTKQTRNVTGLGAGAGQVNFANNGNLRGIHIGSNVTGINTGCFRNATGLSDVTFGFGISSIPSNTFYNCDSLASITIPNSVTSIGVGAFKYCTSLSSITIPDSVTSIGDNAF
jgi:hypothetical protein